MDKTKFGDRMKLFEGAEAGRRLMKLLPVIARLDGKNFSKFTRGMQRPFDPVYADAIDRLAEWLVVETGACISYAQSDEINLVWYSDDYNSQIFHDGRIQKMVSILAAMASVKFNQLIAEVLPDKVKESPLFDCRVWNVPTLMEGVNSILWRQYDAIRNSIQMTAQSVFSHNELHGKHTGQMLEMLREKDVYWEDNPLRFKRGAYFQRFRKERRFSVEELEKLPPKHEAHSNPELTVVRSGVRCLDSMESLADVENRIGVVFFGEEPVLWDTQAAR